MRRGAWKRVRKRPAPCHSVIAVKIRIETGGETNMALQSEFRGGAVLSIRGPLRNERRMTRRQAASELRSLRFRHAQIDAAIRALEQLERAPRQ
jgi:hypothetical protein